MIHSVDTDDGPLVYTVPDVMQLLRVSRRTVEVLIRSGELASFKILGCRRIERKAVHDLLDRCRDADS